MRPDEQRRSASALRTRTPIISIATGAIGGGALALALLLGAEPSATGMPAHGSARLVNPPAQVEESYGDEAAAALASALDSGLAADDEEKLLQVRTLAVGRGDTLMGVLVKAGAERAQAYAAIQALRAVQNPRRLKPGQEITLTFEADADGAPRLVDVSLDADVERRVVARLSGEGDYKAESIDKPLERDALGAAGMIDDSLYNAAQSAGVPAQVIVSLIRLYSFDVDFQRDIQPGDRFELMYEVLRDETGAVVKSQEILYAKLTAGSKTLSLYRFRHEDGETGYYNEKGESVRKALMKTPVDGARLSSNYGLRKHPILGYTKMHRGIDFAAPQGTPIMAAGDGRIEEAGWNGGYGRYVRIRHNSEFKTAYAHLSRIAKGIRDGARVSQGEIIGYVGSTGRSTGPHLHYEVLRRERQINPIGLKLPTGRKLSGRERLAFQTAKEALDAHYASVLQPTERLVRSE